jgi:hypothetical protein
MFQLKISTKNQSKLSTRRAQDDLDRCLASGASGESGECHMSCKEPLTSEIIRMFPMAHRHESHRDWVDELARLGPLVPRCSTHHFPTSSTWSDWMHMNHMNAWYRKCFWQFFSEQDFPQIFATVSCDGKNMTGVGFWTAHVQKIWQQNWNFMKFKQLSLHHKIFSVSDQNYDVVTRCEAHRLLGTVGIRCTQTHGHMARKRLCKVTISIGNLTEHQLIQVLIQILTLFKNIVAGSFGRSAGGLASLPRS